MYSMKNLLQREPNAIREFVLAVLGVLVMTGVVHISAEAVAGIGLVVSSGLGLLYVRQMTVSKAGLRKLATLKKPAKKK